MAQAKNKIQGTAPGGSSGKSKATAHYLIDHGEIRRWAEARNAAPACVRHTGSGGDIGMIRLDFPGYSGEASLEHIDWGEWFEKFDEKNLALLVQDETAKGQQSNFNKLVGRETAEAREHGVKTSRHHPASISAITHSQRSDKTSAPKTKQAPAAAGPMGRTARATETSHTTKKVESIDSRKKSDARGRTKKPAA